MSAEEPTGGGGRDRSSRATWRLTRSRAGTTVAGLPEVVIIVVIVIIEVPVEVFGVAEVSIGRAVVLDHSTTQGRVVHVAILSRAAHLDNGLPGSAGSRRATTSARFHSTRLQRRRYAFKLVGRVVESERQDDVVRERLVLGDGVARQRRVDARTYGGKLFGVSPLSGEKSRELRCDCSPLLRTGGT